MTFLQIPLMIVHMEELQVEASDGAAPRASFNKTRVVFIV